MLRPKTQIVRPLVVLLVFFFCLAVASSWGALLTINNPSFEVDSVANGLEIGSATGWTTTGNAGDAGVRDPSFSDYGVTLPDGDQLGFARIGTGSTPSSLQQTLSATLQSYAIYTLSASVGDRIPTSPVLPTFSVSLYANGNLLASTSTPPPANSGFTNVVATFETVDTSLYFGQNLRIVLSADSGVDGAVVDFDLVTLDFVSTANPEPSTVALLLVGGLIASRRFRKR